MKDLDKQIIITEDGSHTILIPSMEESYHSKNGAIQESSYVFITRGLHFYLNKFQVRDQELNILEVGFGTGLNAILTAEIFRNTTHLSGTYTSLEPFPLDQELISALNYCKEMGLDQDLWKEIHTMPWNRITEIFTNFKLYKIDSRIEDFTADRTYDLVFFDAFAPSRQPEIWDEPIFSQLYGMMKPGAILTTYCSQGQFKRTLLTVGFEIEVLPGPPGKREMVRATKH